MELQLELFSLLMMCGLWCHSFSCVRTVLLSYGAHFASVYSIFFIELYILVLISYKLIQFVKVREIYGLDEKTVFRNVTVSLEGRPQPLYLGTATQIGMLRVL